MEGPVALVGSGEFLPQMRDVDRHLLRGRAPRAVFLPTAAGTEGEARVAHWVELGERHFRAIGVDAVPLRVLDRAGAEDPGIAARVAGAGLVYMSGGDPHHLVETLRGSAVWTAVTAAWRGGAALAGCSAGAMALGGVAASIRGDGSFFAALGAVPGLAVIPHFDRVAPWRPELVGAATDRAPDGVTVVGVDEDTALVGGSGGWTVMGRQSVWLLGPGGRRTGHAAGAAVRVPRLA